MMRRLGCLSIFSSCFITIPHAFQYSSIAKFGRNPCSLLTTKAQLSRNFDSSLSLQRSFSDNKVPDEGPSDVAQRVLAQYETESGLNKTPQSLEHQKIITITRQWVKDWVIRHRLCPWAASVYSETAMRVKVIDADVSHPKGQEEMIYQILAECVLLSHAINIKDEHKTTLLVLPSLQKFDDFLDMYAILEDMLPSGDEDESLTDSHHEKDISNTEKAGNSDDSEPELPKSTMQEKLPLEELLQIATFHPQYTFADSQSATSVENYTNRAPYPVFHLLSVKEVAAALDSFAGDPDDIWRRNVDLMRSMGRSAIRKELKEIVQRGLDAHKLAVEQKE